MTLCFCEVLLAAFICSVLTIVFYIASLFQQEKSNEKPEMTQPNLSNLQGLENDVSLPTGEPDEILVFDQHSSDSHGDVIKEKSDLTRLQDEDFRARVKNPKANEEHIADDFVYVPSNADDPVVHPDDKVGRLHLSIHYDDARKKLMVQIVDAEGIIRPSQTYALDMMLSFTLIGPDQSDDEEPEKHTRVIVENAPVSWKEPMGFSITLGDALKRHLYVHVKNDSDPAAPRDREVSIPLDKLVGDSKEINEWFDLQYVQNSY